MTTTTDNNEVLSIEIFNKLANKSPRFYRISCMLLDHFIMCLFTIPLAVLFIIISEKLEFKPIKDLEGYIWSLIIFIYYNKDFFNAKSPAKRMMGYQVVDKRTKQPATEFQCFVRNLTICFIWPVEVIFAFYNPERRIGDFIALTKVVSSEKVPIKSIWSDLKKIKLKTNYIGIIIIGTIYLYGLNYLIF